MARLDALNCTGRQNFGDAPGHIPKLILTLCHKSPFQSQQREKERKERKTEKESKKEKTREKEKRGEKNRENREKKEKRKKRRERCYWQKFYKLAEMLYIGRNAQNLKKWVLLAGYI